VAREQGNKVIASNRRARHDYVIEHGTGRSTRVVSQARGLEGKGETEGFEPLKLIEV